MKQNEPALLLMLKGMAMGIAEVIPGVSGGTIAFITGIYERLLNAIKAFGLEGFKGLKANGLKGFWAAIDGNFLATLGIGMVAGLVTGIFGVSHLLEHYPLLLWGFFFGLIIASALLIGRQVSSWSLVTILAMIACAAIAFYITVASPSQGNEATWFVFISGAIAICALMLPGISGSFILLLLGMYTYVLGTVKTALETFSLSALTVTAVFALGCATGAVTFSRVLSWTFKKFPNQTLALLTGFLLGSLNKIWPWRQITEYRTNSHGETVPFLDKSVLPNTYDGDPQLIWVLICMAAGFAIVSLLERMGKKNG